MFIYTTSTMHPSAKALANSLTHRLGRKVYVTSNPETGLRGPAIRWGNSNSLPYDVNGISKGNSAEFIKTCSNKAEFARVMTLLNIECIKLRTGNPDKYPIVLRKTLTGYGGNGIEVCQNQFEFAGRTNIHWGYWRNLRPELGAHIFEGKIIKLFKKVRENSQPDEQFPIRNADRGYHFSRVDVENYPKLIPFVENFYREFPIMFGRMDVGWDYDTKVYRVIEFNTAPGLTNNLDTLQAYTSAFESIL